MPLGLFPAFAGPLILALGLLVIIGWATDSQALIGLGPGGTAILPNTAAALVLIGVSLTLLQDGRAPRPRYAAVIAGILGTALLVFGLAVMNASFRGVDLAVDGWLFPESTRRLPWVPTGRIANNTAICLTLLGLAIISLSVGALAAPIAARGRRVEWPLAIARISATLALLVSFLGLVGYTYGVTELYHYGSVRGGMALATAITMFLASLGTLALRPTRGFAGLLLGDDAGGLLARRLLPAAVLIPFGLGWLWLEVRREGVVNRESGVALFVIANIVVFALVISSVARTVRAMNGERERLLEREREARREAERASGAFAVATRQAEDARRDAELANLAKSDFLARMSHELRTPLNAIAGYSELLSLGLRGPVTEAQRTDLDRIQRAQRHLLGLINDVLNMAKLEAGRVDLQMQSVRVSDVLDGVAAVAGALVDKKGLTLELKPVARDRPPLVALADEEKLAQILLNLLSNAIKFTPTGGTITVSAEQREPAEIRIHVSDTGPGISLADRDRIFEPFVQLHAGLSSALVEGTGLGLAISRDLARAMNGDLIVQSEPGAGSTFTLVLRAGTFAATTSGRVSAAPEARQEIREARS
jgi:signal transduction histidine kinase